MAAARRSGEASHASTRGKQQRPLAFESRLDETAAAAVERLAGGSAERVAQSLVGEPAGRALDRFALLVDGHERDRTYRDQRPDVIDQSHEGSVLKRLSRVLRG